MPYRYDIHPCACSFAKTVEDTDGTHFPRVGIVDNVLLRGNCWLIEHRPTGKQALIRRPGEGPLHAEAAPCCFKYFDAP